MTRAGSDPTAVTIVIPTHNQPARAENCVNALLHCSDTFEDRAQIIVIDNGSRDDVAARVAKIGSSSPRVHVITDPEPGANRARNRGLVEACSALVAFVDEDVLVEPGWLDAICAPFADPAVIAVVGRVVLAPVRPRPDWLTTDLETWYSALDLGDRDHELAPETFGWSANLAVRRDTALGIGGFNEGFGPGRRAHYNDDVDFVTRLRPTGAIWYAADARARHRIGNERLTRRWLLHRTFLQGRSDAALLHARGATESGALRLVSDRLLDVVARRWWRTLRRCRSRATRQSVLLRDGMRRSEALGFALEHSRAVIRRRDR